MDPSTLLTEKDKKLLATAAFYEMKNGNLSLLGKTTNDNFLFKFRRLDPIDPESKQEATYKDASLMVTRAEFDSLITMYFEEHTFADCEAVLIHKLLLKRGFSKHKTLQQAKVIEKEAVPAH